MAMAGAGMENLVGLGHLASAQGSLVNPDFVDQAVEAKFAGKGVMEGFGRQSQDAGLANADVCVDRFHPTVADNFPGDFLSVDIETHHALGLVVRARNVVPAEEHQMVLVRVRGTGRHGKLLPDAADLRHETWIAVAIDAEEVTVVVALLHQGSPVPRVGTQGKPSLERQIAADYRGLGRRQRDQRVIAVELQCRT